MLREWVIAAKQRTLRGLGFLTPNPQNLVKDHQNLVKDPQNLVKDPQNLVKDPQNLVRLSGRNRNPGLENPLLAVPGTAFLHLPGLSLPFGFGCGA